MKTVAVILVNWNGIKDTRSSIKQYLAQDYPDIQIIVVDNGSRHNDEKLLTDEFKDKITLIQTGKNLGYSGGNNVGMKYALKQHYPYILFSNSDIFFGKNFVTDLVAPLEKDPHIGAVCPKIYYYHDKKKIWFVDGPINWWKGATHSKHQGETDHGQFNRRHKTDRLVGTALLTRSDILKKIGGFSDEYFMYLEDVDLSVRIKRAGYEVLVIPKAKLWHNESSSTAGKDSPYIIYYFTRNTLIFMKHYGNRLQFTTSTLYGIYFCFRRIISHIVKRKLSIATLKATIFAYYDFLRGKRGIIKHKL